VVCYGYAASKAAIINIVRQAALELAPHGVLVNAICPGPFKGTRIGGGVTENPDPEMEHMWATTIPLGRMADPEELKGLVLLLASPASSFMTGAAYLIDGGTLVLAGTSCAKGTGGAGVPRAARSRLIEPHLPEAAACCLV
jgi:NAD(P)-dependent dehydrogenase (short-subunit alcohol dehydrogenase family)